MAAEVLALGILLADGADRRRRREERAHAVLGDDAPEGAGIRRSDRLALVHHRRAPGQERRVDDVGVADDPADVGRGPEDVAGVGVVDVRHRPLQGDRVAAVVADDALRPSCRARRVQDVERIGRRDRHRIGRRGRGDLLGPVEVAPGGHGRLGLRPLQDDHVAGPVRRERERAIEQRLVGDHARALDTARRRKHERRPGVVDAHGELVRCEAAEHDRVDRADAGAGEHRDRRLGHHRHVDHDAVAAARAEAGEHPRRPRDLVAQLRVGEAADAGRDRAVVDQRQAVAVAGVDVAVEGVLARVQDAAGEPAVERRAATVEHLLGRAAPRDRRGGLAPEGVGVRQAACVQSCRAVTHRTRRVYQRPIRANCWKYPPVGGGRVRRFGEGPRPSPPLASGHRGPNDHR